MEFKALGLLVLFSFALADLEHSYEDAQKALADGRNEALGRLNATLASGPPVDQDEAVLRLGHVHRVYEAGRQDLELIKNFTGPGNKTEALASSVRFWKEKMNNATKPITRNPFWVPSTRSSTEPPRPDPESNSSEAVRLKMAEIDEKVRQSIESLRSDGMRWITANPHQLHEITKWSNSKLNMELVLDNFVPFLRARGEDAKQEIARGVAEKGEQELASVAATALDNFKSGLFIRTLPFRTMLSIFANY